MYRRTAKHSNLIIMVTLNDSLTYAKSLYTYEKNFSIETLRNTASLIIY